MMTFKRTLAVLALTFTLSAGAALAAKQNPIPDPSDYGNVKQNPIPDPSDYGNAKQNPIPDPSDYGN
jgi:hypothetical protein